MRMEELSENRYVKGVDTVEKYLLELVRDFLKQDNFKPPESSREYIIEEALKRMKEELIFEQMGVTSIKFPDGTEKTGIVNITLKDLGGEPAIKLKRSAFNVSFGNKQNTACEGNDPRLSDKRIPLAHQHDVSDIIGLQGIVSTLQGKIDRLSDTVHEHGNSSLLEKLVYSGNNTTIDLTVLDSFESVVQQTLSGVEGKIATCKQQFDNSVLNIDTNVNNALQEINTLKTQAISLNQSCLQQAKAYTDTEVSALESSIQQQSEQFITRDLLTPIVGIANTTLTLVGSMEIPFSSIFHQMSNVKRYTSTILIDTAIIDELIDRGQLLSNCQIECFVEYTHPSINKVIKTALPYIICNNGMIDGTLQMNTIYSDNSILVTLDTLSQQISKELLNSKLIYNVYAIQPTSL